MKKLKAGVAGFGKSAKVFHIPFLVTLPEYELAAVLERRTDESAKQFPGVKVARSIEELLQCDIDLVVVTTPNDTHFEYASKALLAGKHVVLEKPFTITLDEGKKLIDIARSTGKVLSVYQNRRYVSDYYTIKDVLDRKLVGDVHEFTANYDRYRADPVAGSWREADLPGSGILYDLGPHLIDQALTLFGHPHAITADIRKQRWFSTVDDYFNIWLDYGFLKVILHAGMLVREQGPRYIIQGTKGSFIKTGEDPQEAALKEGRLPVSNDWGAEPEEFYGVLHTEASGKPVKERIVSKRGDYAEYYRSVYRSITEGAVVTEKPEHGYNTIRIIQLAFQSSNEKRTLVCDGLLA